jgi:hypothetical protein
MEEVSADDIPYEGENVIWKEIPGLKYEASNTGLIRNKKTLHHVCLFNMGGYMNVICHKKRYRVHRLIAKAFLPNPEQLTDIDHLDGDKLNNRVDNLVWDSHQHNVKKHFDNKPLNVNIPVCLKFSDDTETLFFESMNETARYFHRSIGTIYSTLQTALSRPAYRWHGYKIEKISNDEYLEGCVRHLIAEEGLGDGL